MEHAIFCCIKSSTVNVITIIISKNWYQWLIIVHHSLKQLFGTCFKEEIIKSCDWVQWIFSVYI